MSCAICGREARGFAFRDVAFPNSPILRACSMSHLILIQHANKVGEKVNITQYEQEAVELSMEAVGSYIEATGKSDLATMSVEEFKGLIACAFTTVAKHVGEICDVRSVPF